MLLKSEDEQARLFHMQETVDYNWSMRTLERQICNLYYERMLMSHNTQIVRDEATEKEIRQEPKDIIKDPYVLEFYGINGNKSQPASLNFSYKVYIINKAQKQKIRKQLEALGIDKSTLFPEVEHVAEHIKDKYHLPK